MKYVHKHYSLKQPACTLEGATNNANQCWIQNKTLPYKFVSPWWFICITADSLHINKYTKPTIHTILQTKFQYIGGLKCIVYWLPNYKLDCFTTKHWNTWSLKMYKLQCHLQTINIMKANRPCTEQEIK